MKSLLSYINDEIQPDVALWGGDSIPHNIDTLVLENSVEIMKNVSAEVIGTIKNARIYPTIGNHDTYPQDIIKMSIPKENVAINQWIDSWDDLVKDPV